MTSEDVVPALILSDTLDHVTDITQYPCLQLTHDQRLSDDGFVISSERQIATLPQLLFKALMLQQRSDTIHWYREEPRRCSHARKWTTTLLTATSAGVRISTMTSTDGGVKSKPTTRSTHWPEQSLLKKILVVRDCSVHHALDLV
jgi:hypothetical protein